MADYDAALARDPDNSDALRARAAALIRTNSFAKAIADLDRFIQLEPKNAQAYYQRGFAYEQQGQHAKAIDDYNKAIARDASMTRRARRWPMPPPSSAGTWPKSSRSSKNRSSRRAELAETETTR